MAYSFVGTWRATIVVNGRYAYDSLVLEGDGNVNELLRAGTLMTEQTGEWRIVHGLLYLNVEDWQPKVASRQDCLDRVQWLSANAIRCQDVNLGGYVIYRRAYVPPRASQGGWPQAHASSSSRSLAR